MDACGAPPCAANVVADALVAPAATRSVEAVVELQIARWMYSRQCLWDVAGMVAEFCTVATMMNLARALAHILPQFSAAITEKFRRRAGPIVLRYLVIRASCFTYDRTAGGIRDAYGFVGSIPAPIEPSGCNGWWQKIERPPATRTTLARVNDIATFLVVWGYNLQRLTLYGGVQEVPGSRQYYRTVSPTEERACLFRMPSDGYVRGTILCEFAFHLLTIQCNPSGRITGHVQFGYRLPRRERDFVNETSSVFTVLEGPSPAERTAMHRAEKLFLSSNCRILVGPAYIHVVALNGPPGCGKGSVAALLVQRGWRNRTFRERLYTTVQARVQARYKISSRRWAQLCRREHEPAIDLGDHSPWAVAHMIQMGPGTPESCAMFWRARARDLCNVMSRDRAQRVVVSDCRYQDELDELVAVFGATNVTLVCLSRRKCPFPAGHTGYVRPSGQCRTLDLHSNSDVGALASAILATIPPF